MNRSALISGKPSGGNPSNGQALVYNSATGLWEPGTAGAASSLAATQMPGATTWTIPGVIPTEGTLVARANIAGRCDYGPIWLTRATAFTALGVEITTGAAGSTIDLGIYAVDAAWQPAALQAAVQVSGVSTGRISGVIAKTLQPGPYLLAMLPSSSSIVLGTTFGVGPLSILTGTANIHLLGKAGSSGPPLPDPGQAWAAILTGSAYYLYKVFMQGSAV